MTPKEKAKELYRKMYTTHANIYPQTAIECALIAVDEIINSVPIAPLELSQPLFYWQQVKQEIEKL